MNHAVVFDWDGTLVQSCPTLAAAFRITTESVLGQRYPATPQEEQLLLQLGERETLRMLCDPSELEQALDEFVGQYRHRCTAVVAYPGVERVLLSLRTVGWRIGVVSNGEPGRVRDDLGRLGLDTAVDAVLCSDETSSWIPHPAPLHAMLELLGASGPSSVFVGDAPADLTAGRAAGMRTVAAGYGYESGRLDRDGTVDRVLRPHDLLRLLSAAGPAGGTAAQRSG